jgi:hypothetical protein
MVFRPSRVARYHDNGMADGRSVQSLCRRRRRWPLTWCKAAQAVSVSVTSPVTANLAPSANNNCIAEPTKCTGNLASRAQQRTMVLVGISYVALRIVTASPMSLLEFSLQPSPLPPTTTASLNRPDNLSSRAQQRTMVWVRISYVALRTVVHALYPHALFTRY